MKRKCYYFLVFICLFFFTFSFVLAENEKIEIKSGTKKFENLIFSVPQNSQHTSEILISNKGEEDLNLILYISPDKNSSLVEAIKKKEGNDLFLNTFFYFDIPPIKYQEELKNNYGEIIPLCEKYKNSKDKAIKNWCKGSKIVTLFLKKGESKIVPFTISISKNSEEHKAFFSVILEKDKENKILSQVELIYEIPKNKVFEEEKMMQINFESFSFKRTFSFFEIFDWMNSGFRENYEANFSILNNENKDFSANFFVKTDSFFFGEKNILVDSKVKTGKNEVKLNVKMPFLGKVKIIGGAKIFDDKIKKNKEFLIEEWNIFIFPVREISVFFIFLLLFLIFLWYKKKNLNNILEGKKWIKYKIKEGDNVINLAFLYGISWKELVNFNQIKPPYTLIKGNVIMVPPRLKKVFKHTFMQNKNYYEDQDESLNSNDAGNLRDYPDPVSNSQNFSENHLVHKTSFSVRSNIIQEESNELGQQNNIENSNSNLNQVSSLNKVSPEKRFVNMRSVDMRGPIRRNLSRENFNQLQRNSVSPEILPSKDFENPKVVVGEEFEENQTPISENLTRKKDVVILPKFIVNKTMAVSSNGGGGLPPRKNMDIRWMHEDNDAYDEAMYDEVKAINFKIKVILLIIVAIVALLGYWIFSYFKNNNSPENSTSINELATNQNNQNNQVNSEEESKKLEKEVEEKKKVEEAKNNSESSKNETKTETPKEEEDGKKLSEISVQVLNGGAKSGVATELSDIFKGKGYNVKNPSNAKNNVSGVVIYYKSSLEKEIIELSKNVPSTYGQVKLEKSDEVSKMYKVDVIVVAGK